MKQTRRHFTAEEKQDLVTQIQDQVKAGETINKACEQAGIRAQVYRNWINRLPKGGRNYIAKGPKRKKRKSVNHITINAATLSPPTSRFVFVMDVDTALEFARRNHG